MIDFKNFVLNVGKESRFIPLKNRLLLSILKIGEENLKEYNKILEIMRSYWPKYEENSSIALLLNDHYEELFSHYLSVIFPFRLEGLELKDPEVLTLVDFKLFYSYHYNKKEIQEIEEIKKDLELKEKTNKILEKLFIFSIASFSSIIEKIFPRPFAFQFRKLEINYLSEDEIIVETIICGREQ